MPGITGVYSTSAGETALGRSVTILKKPFDVEDLREALRSASPLAADG